MKKYYDVNYYLVLNGVKFFLARGHRYEEESLQVDYTIKETFATTEELLNYSNTHWHMEWSRWKVKYHLFSRKVKGIYTPTKDFLPIDKEINAYIMTTQKESSMRLSEIEKLMSHQEFIQLLKDRGLGYDLKNRG